MSCCVCQLESNDYLHTNLESMKVLVSQKKKIIPVKFVVK
jgi:hypothetical protein